MTNTFEFDLSELEDRYNEILISVASFLENNEFPAVKAHLIKYVNNLNTLESKVITLKSEITITRALADLERKRNTKLAYANARQWDSLQRWQSEYAVDDEPSVADAKAVVDKLDAMTASLADYRWQLINNRGLSIKFYNFMSGEED